ncbi:SDA1-like protein, partial [Trifolium medium]|nr:SDA1-like protein [Trifolium medium]
VINIKETLPLFMEHQPGDKPLREMTFMHIVKSIKRMNLEHPQSTENS